MSRHGDQYTQRVQPRPARTPMTREQVRQLGREVGFWTGILGYFGGALMAWAFNLSFFLATHRPTDSTAKPIGWLVGAGAAIGVLLTMFIVARFLRAIKYPDRSFRMASSASAFGDVARGTTAGAGAAVVFLLVAVYAMCVVLMWVLASVVLIAAIAT